MPKITEITDNLVRDLCSVEFRSKSKTRELIKSSLSSLLDEVEKELQGEFGGEYYGDASEAYRKGRSDYEYEVKETLSDLRKELN